MKRKEKSLFTLTKLLKEKLEENQTLDLNLVIKNLKINEQKKI